MARSLVRVIPCVAHFLIKFSTGNNNAVDQPTIPMLAMRLLSKLVDPNYYAGNTTLYA